MVSKHWLRVGVAMAAGVLLATSAAAKEPETGTLTLDATGFESEDGEVLIQLANSREDYESDDDGFRVAKIKAVGGKATTVFEGLPYGEYAIKVFHDENANGELDIGWTGPEEVYGFSNDARSLMGPPDWDETKFTLSEAAQTAKVAVK